MHETADELLRLQSLLDDSFAGAGTHLRATAADDNRLDAQALCRRLTGMRLITVASSTSDGRPISAPTDGYFLHGPFWFTTSPDSVRGRHLTRRPAVSLTHLPSEKLAVWAHGMATVQPFPSPETAELRQAMLEHYLPLQGPSFQQWLDALDGALAVRVTASRMFTFTLEE